MCVLKMSYLLSLCFVSFLWAKDLEIVVIGMASGGAPAFEETFDKRLRENLSTMPDLFLVDYLQTQLYRQKIRFNEFPTVSRKLVESLKQYSSDSALFIWGQIKDYSVKGIRRRMIRGYIHGEIVVTLNIYSLRYKNYAFSGDIHVDAEKPKGFLFFGDAENEVLISGIEKNGIIDQLIDKAALQSSMIIAAIMRGERLHAAKESDAKNMSKYEVPSVSDMFTVPSVEAASINKTRKKPVTTSDTLSRPNKSVQKKPEKNDSLGQAQKTKPMIDTIRAGEKKK
jgi:hypothetical protein